ncbi:MAG TPA: glycerol-3-phosphate 1-O-acyltransferase PlsY [Gemmatimonadaceae bacterium]|nr:glycerol-3-phosphate 1-O-acyltransferase PlsY [Gemmatimonadaceae bacterium]
MHPALAIAIAYAAGSIPSAYIAGKARGVDLRKHGSGNLGATNVIRVLGTKIGLVVFAFDVAKGALPVLLLPRYTVSNFPPVWMAIACGVAAILGHTRPLFLLFQRGGKGVATAAGVFLALAPIQTLLALIVFAVVLLTSGYVSLGSLISASLLPVLIGVTLGPRSPVFAISIVVALFVYWTHRTNIGRLRRGEEHRFGKPGTQPSRRMAAALAIGLVVVLAVLVAARFAT